MQAYALIYKHCSENDSHSNNYKKQTQRKTIMRESKQIKGVRLITGALYSAVYNDI